MRAAFPLVVALLLFAAAMWMPPAAYARDWSVDLDGSGDFTSIGAAIEAAAEGDTISIGPGDYSAESLDPIVVSLTMRSAVAEARPLLPYLGVRRVGRFDLEGVEIRGSPYAALYDQAVSTRISNCVIAECEEVGIRFWADSVRVVGCTFEGNRGGDDWSEPLAGAIVFNGRNGSGVLIVERCTFVENGTLGNGGAIDFSGHELIVRNSYFEGNEANEGAAIYMPFARSHDRIVIENNTFIRNVADYTTIYVDGDAPSYINNNIFAFNDAYGYWVEGWGRCGCNVLWQNRSWGLNELEWGGGCEWTQLYESNERIDPGFCNAGEGDYTLSATSPGLPENFTPLFREQGCEGLVGAFEMGCQMSPTREISWGALKRLLGGAAGDSVSVPAPPEGR